TVSSSSDAAVPTGSSATLRSYASVAGLSYTDFGTWNVAVNGTTAYTAAYAGSSNTTTSNQTAPGNMPTSGTATYNGGATGTIVAGKGA
ncbi:hypothetical protein KQH43_31215, partial [Streptomyces sp. EL5]|uniref:hypothetical protein n=1 Tax=Streptomyces sp. EL5 TaxID=2841665 RepID=UPI0020945734